VAGEVPDKWFGMKSFRVFPYPEKAKLAYSRATELAREEHEEENGSHGGRLV
jgi:hypothetical protein